MRATRRRRFDLSAVSELLLAVPTVLSSLLVVTLLGKPVTPQSPWLFPVLWLVSGVIAFLPVTDGALAWLVHRLRRPTPSESQVLVPLLESVCDTASVDPRRYRLWIQNSREINAMAVGGRVVGVSTAALSLPPRQLEAVLAHEVGHHLAGHTRASLLRWWYELPARLAVLLAFALGWGVLEAGAALKTRPAMVTSLVLVAALAVVAVAVSPWVLLLPVIAPLLALTSRRAELRADRVAAELGYGPLLLEVLQRWRNEGHDVLRARAGLRARMLASHPSCTQRISKLYETRTAPEPKLGGRQSLKPTEA
ncbi:M48 family metalloprotease [Lentzea sp.]|uniref:M48 family metalloprotease n=1 Tax=Lentzea sp. TaxID=56099 RepID=UPI002BB61358|nr:M48 family metalloprotease [Lentzea sp.]HUQ59792.1 M48 family metalloprotease [Lentzea sp.]